MDENFRTTFDRLISEYEDQQPAYKAFATFIREVLATAAGKLMPYAVVEARAKDMASFAEKVVRKRKKYQTIPGSFTHTVAHEGKVLYAGPDQ